jgi:hypothetical protein
LGHLYLGNFPRTCRWKQLLALLESGAGLQQLADASFNAAHTGLKRFPGDEGFLATISSIVELAAASREKDISEALTSAGIRPEDQTSSFGLLSSVPDRLTRELRQTGGKSDIGKIARDVFLDSLTRQGIPG